MMSVLSKVLVVSLFVLLSAVLFAAFLPLVFNTLMGFYGHQSASKPQGKFSAGDVDKSSPQIDFQPDVPEPTPPPVQHSAAEPGRRGTSIDVQPYKPIDVQPYKPDVPEPTPPPVQPFAVAQEFFMTSWVSITAGLSLSVTAAIFLAIGQITHRFKQWRVTRPLVAKMP